MHTPSWDESARCKQMYLDQLDPYFSQKEMEAIRAAYVFSEHGHAHQWREDGSPYFFHPRDVSVIASSEMNMYDRDLIITCLLHDIREDSYILSEYRMALNFGKWVAEYVRLLSKDPQSKPVFFDRLKKCGKWRAVVAKICDRLHNIRTLDDCRRERQEVQVKETRAHYFELCDIAEQLVPRQYRAAVAILRSELDKECRRYE